MKRRVVGLLLATAGLAALAAGAIWYRNRFYANTPRGGVPAPSDIGIRRQIADYDGAAPPAYRWPAEFEPQEAVWMLWPSEVYGSKNEPVTPAMVDIVKALAAYVRVNVVARTSGEIGQIQDQLKSSGYTGPNAHFYIFDHASIWTRDVGPLFVRDGQNKLNVVDFRFNNYSRDGSEQYIDTENELHRRIAGSFGYPLVPTTLVSEGGAIESNGRGTMLATEAVALKRNPGMTRQQIEDEYKRVLGVKKVIWLKSGLAEDDRITSGHINEFCRFADPNTILLASVLPGDRDASDFSRESYRRMEENYNILIQAIDQDGKPFHIIRIPMPPGLYGEAESAGAPPVRSYLNFAITNGAVLMQTYWRSGRPDELKTVEDGVKETLKGAFPGREIVGVGAESVNAWGGGIHCVTQHMPGE